MTLTNYRDLSTWATDTSAGFQFEFYCVKCESTWRSPFQPYRVGQFTALVARVETFFSGVRGISRIARGATDQGSGRAKADALQEAMVAAQPRYQRCDGCREFVCNDCWNERAELCVKCAAKQGGTSVPQRSAAAQDDDQPTAAVHACPSCGAGSDGGRFCAECGFDMASTFKSCPACGAMAERETRFCGDCGHAF